MSLLTIFAPPKTRAEWADWAFAHAANHRDIIRVIFERFQVELQEPLLDPFNPTAQWIYQHQVLHSAQDTVLGIPSQDLTTVDWRDEDSVADWIQTHFVEHQAASRILNLG